MRYITDSVKSKLLTALQRTGPAENLDTSGELAVLVDDPHCAFSDGPVDAEQNGCGPTRVGIIETNDEVVADEVSNYENPFVITETEKAWEARSEVLWKDWCEVLRLRDDDAAEARLN